MFYRIAIVTALAGSVSALPNLLHIRQGVTTNIAPDEPTPAGFLDTLPGTFGIAVVNITAGAADVPPTTPTAAGDAQPVTQVSDGQPQATSGEVVTQITDGQPQAATVMTAGRVSQITDGQIQAPTSHAGITVTPISQISDGQPQAPTVAPVTQISDGQPQAPAQTAAPVSQISDGQPQAPAQTAAPVSQISDGQPQAPATVAPVSQISDGQPQAPAQTVAPVSQISDGQPQAPAQTEAPVSQIGDGQPQAPAQTEAPVSQITDGQPQAPAQTEAPVSQIGDGQPQNPPSKRAIMAIVGCESANTLSITLNNGVLIDDLGRTGYIASNRQFQFDKPAQAGAIFTAGWSVAPNGSLALGDSTTFFQCRSGDFFNLYDQSIAAQCNAVNIQTLMLEQC